MTDNFIQEQLGLSGQEFVSRLLTLVAIALLTWLARRLAGRLVKLFLNVIFRALRAIRRKEIEFEETLAAAITPPMRLLVTIIGIRLALLVFDLPENVRQVLPGLFSALSAYAIFWAVFRAADVLSAYYLRQATDATTPYDETLTRFVGHVVKIVIVAFAIVVIAREIGYDLGGVLAGLGLGGLAVALAAQDALANLIGYFAIVADSTYKVGDLITINDVEAFVEDITLRSTRLRKRDRSLVMFPNQIMASSPITNWSRLHRRQIRMTLGVTYSTTPEQVEAVLAELRTMLGEHEKVVAGSVLVEFVEFGASSLDLLVMCLVKTIKWEELQAIKTDLNLRIMRLLSKHGVQVAFPTRSIWIENQAQS